MENFSCKTRILSGTGTIRSLGQLDIQNLFVVADPFFVKNGTVQRVVEASGAKQWELFDHVRPDPTVELAAEGTARLKGSGADTLVALGGGSAMDCAKAMAYFAKTQCRLVAIPTTSGSGSEVTDFAILTHDGVKHPLVDARLRPDIAILDGELLTNLPPTLVAEGGFDVLAHALEAVAAKNAGTISDCFAREAFTTAYGLLPASYAGRTEVRLKIHRAATMAGMAFTHAGLGLCHALSHALGGMFHVAHGRLNAILLPSVVACNAHAAGKAYARIARAAGIAGSTDALAVRNLQNGLIRLRRELELPQTLAQAGVHPGDVWERSDAIVQAAMEDPCWESNPVAADDFLIRRILEEVTGRG